MTTLTPRKPYTKDELNQLYPADLQLQLVQILLRHGERSPVSVRFQNAGLPAFWPYCAAVTQLKSAVLDRSMTPSAFTTLEWKRRLEAFGPGDEPIVASGPRGELDAICDMGMLTDKGRQTTFDLGSRLRRLYVEQLGFMPHTINDADSLYLRATPIPRALESLQETFLGLYPTHTRAPNFPPPSILTRAAQDETLFPNDSNCRRLAALARAFAQRAADRWNDTDEMAYLNKLYGKWMPEDSQRVAVDSHPRLSGIMDTINSTLAHGPDTRLPKDFYDKKGRDIIEKIGVEEWFAGYKESREYRTLGIGGLMGDVVSRMVGSAERSTADGEYEIARNLETKGVRDGRGATPIRFGLSGCHDTTLAAVLMSLGAYPGDKWPPYTSHIAIEMFRKADVAPAVQGKSTIPPTESSAAGKSTSSWFASLFSWKSSPEAKTAAGLPPPGIGRKRTEDLSVAEKDRIDGYYVRLRYNDEVVTVSGCKTPGNHLEGNESFCTLAAFKAIVDKFVPRNWKAECAVSIKEPAFPAKPEPAGY
ncbi:histidine acid phosphatase [Pseudomassariella vexata]|uniref:3-phytase n=1 Tax=Pseudomassariella vexata TaxID=1141098 RepID=A0A1Y2DIU0_9PEZI|nr:histidine acid phosphatase [Pseudomassariella vexata]ORY59143.1 histidine acid phosphatase [Pseudomassariella vexata]